MSYPIGIRMGQWYKHSDLRSDWLPIWHSIIKARYRRRKRYPPVFKRRNQRDIFRPQNDGSQNLFRLWRKSVIRKQNTTDDIFGKAKEFGCKAVCFEGNIDFYGKSGFDYANKFGIRYHGLSEDDDASFFLLKELEDGYLSGITGEYATPKGYFAACDNPEDFEKYESSFPFKEKLKLPGQLF